MRTITLSFLLVFQISFISARCQWQWCNPQPSGYYSYKVAFTNTQNGFVINSNGDLIRTTDQGQTWNIQENIPKGSSLDFNDSTGVIGAGTLLYITTDNGKHWTKNAKTFPASVQKVQVVSRDIIFIVSTNQNTGQTALFITSNRGANWQQVNLSFIINALWMTDAHTGYATSSSGAFKTTDGGLSWQKLTISGTSGLFNYVKFRNKDTGFLYRQYNQILKTTDGGATWNTSNARFSGDVYSIAFADDTTAVAVGGDGLILRSIDDGVNWKVINSAYVYANTLTSAVFINASTGFTVGHRGRILKTSDGGLSWKQYATTYIDVRAMQLMNDSTGFAATWNNIYKTTNKGQSWTMLPLTTTDPYEWFESIHFYSKDTGVAISYTNSLKVFKTFDGGQSWRQANFNQIYAGTILGIFYVGNATYLSTSAPYGYAVLKSEDQAETWKLQYQDGSYGGVSINQPFFTSEKTGYAANGYYVYKTTDSAKTWTKLQMIPSQLLRYTWFVNDSVGFVTGDQSYIAKTNDSGHTWTQLHIDPDNGNVPGDLKQIKFCNSKIGFVVCRNNVYRTVTAGASWKLMGPSVWDLLGIEVGSDTSLYAFGTYGMIEKKDIRSCEVDSLKIDSISGCKASLSARITVVLARMDSAWFEYGVGGFASQLPASPLSIQDTSIKITASISGLIANTDYLGRVKYYYKGKYYYSDSIAFSVPGPDAPTITLNAGTLYSSAQQGNQWYLNNTVIPGATQAFYTPSQSGSYSVIASSNGCSTPMSQAYDFVITSLSNPVLPEDIKIFPNPTAGTIYIQNDLRKLLTMTVYSEAGVAVRELQTSGKLTPIDIRNIATGTYWIIIQENKTTKTYLKTILKF